MINKFVTATAAGLLAIGMAASSACAQEAAKARIGYLLSEVVAPPLLAGRDDGLFAARNVQVELIKFDNGTQMTQALVGGSLDGALAGAAVVSSIAVRGLGVLIAPTYSEYDTNLLYATAGSGIKSIADLKGKRIAYPFGTTAHVLVSDTLKAAGLKPSDIQSVNMGYQATATALMSDAVPAAVIGGGFAEKVETKNAVRVTSLRDNYPKTAVLGGLVMGNAYVKSNKDVLPKLVAGLIEGQEHINKESGRKKLYEKYFANVESYEAFDKAYVSGKYPSGPEWMTYFKDGKVAEWTLSTAAILKEAGAIDRIGDPKDYLAPDIYAAGLKLTESKKN